MILEIFPSADSAPLQSRPGLWAYSDMYPDCLTWNVPRYAPYRSEHAHYVGVCIVQAECPSRRGAVMSATIDQSDRTPHNRYDHVNLSFEHASTRERFPTCAKSPREEKEKLRRPRNDDRVSSRDLMRL